MLLSQCVVKCFLRLLSEVKYSYMGPERFSQKICLETQEIFMPRIPFKPFLSKKIKEILFTDLFSKPKSAGNPIRENQGRRATRSAPVGL